MNATHDPFPLISARAVVAKLSASVMSRSVTFRVERDVKRPDDGRVFIQCVYAAPCTVSNHLKEWHGRKWYLSDHMTEDEIVKTCFAAFKAAVEHEVMEGFLFEGQRVFNPHADFRALIAANRNEVYRAPHE